MTTAVWFCCSIKLQPQSGQDRAFTLLQEKFLFSSNPIFFSSQIGEVQLGERSAFLFLLPWSMIIFTQSNLKTRKVLSYAFHSVAFSFSKTSKFLGKRKQRREKPRLNNIERKHQIFCLIQSFFLRCCCKATRMFFGGNSTYCLRLTFFSTQSNAAREKEAFIWSGSKFQEKTDFNIFFPHGHRKSKSTRTGSLWNW